MKPDTTEKVKRYSLCFLGASAHLVLVFALFLSACGLDFTKVTFS